VNEVGQNATSASGEYLRHHVHCGLLRRLLELGRPGR
jgi:hypothetical protein